MMHQLRERLVQGLVEAFQEQKSSFDASMSRLVNRIMDDEIYRDCWEFCKRVMEDGTCREVAACAEREYDQRRTCGEKDSKKNVMRPWIIPDIQGLIRKSCGMPSAWDAGNPQDIHAVSGPCGRSKRLKEMAARQFAILDRGIRD